MDAKDFLKKENLSHLTQLIVENNKVSVTISSLLKIIMLKMYKISDPVMFSGEVCILLKSSVFVHIRIHYE